MRKAAGKKRKKKKEENNGNRGTQTQCNMCEREREAYRHKKKSEGQKCAEGGRKRKREIAVEIVVTDFGWRIKRDGYRIIRSGLHQGL